MPKCLKAAPDSVLRSTWKGCQGAPCLEEAGDWPNGSEVKLKNPMDRGAWGATVHGVTKI